MITKLRSSARRVSKAHSSAVTRSAAGCTIFSWKEHHLIAKDAGRTMASNCAGSRNPVRALSSFGVSISGITINTPRLRASRNARRRTASSRLVLASDAFCSVIRNARYDSMSCPLMVDIRRSGPKYGNTCRSIRRCVASMLLRPRVRWSSMTACNASRRVILPTVGETAIPFPLSPSRDVSKCRCLALRRDQH